MPTYEYQCKACDHKFEKFQSITAAPNKKCPACKANKAKRLIGMGAGVIFKGSGFYQTDYRDASYNEAAKKDNPHAAPCHAASDDCKSCEHAAPVTKKSTGDSSQTDTKNETKKTTGKKDTKK